MTIHRPYKLSRVFASFFVAALSCVASAPSHAQDTQIDMAQIERELRKHFSSEKPNFEAIEQFARRLHDLNIKRLTPDMGRLRFYSIAAMQVFGELGKSNYEAWRNRFPNSPTPILADLTAAFMSRTGNIYAALGSMSYWDSPPNVRNELNSIRSELLHFKAIASQDPYWYTLMLEVCIADKCPRGDLESILDEGLKKFPDNMEMVIVATNHFLPKWSGNIEALEDWASKTSAKLSPAIADTAYAKIYWQAQTAQYGGELFKLTKIDWARMMRGVRADVAQNPNVSTLNAGAAIACLGGARALTKELLQNPQFAFRDVYWHQLTTEYDAYPICRAWAAQQPASNRKSGTAPVPTANP